MKWVLNFKVVADFINWLFKENFSSGNLTIVHLVPMMLKHVFYNKRYKTYSETPLKGSFIVSTGVAILRTIDTSFSYSLGLNHFPIWSVDQFLFRHPELDYVQHLPGQTKRGDFINQGVVRPVLKTE